MRNSLFYANHYILYPFRGPDGELAAATRYLNQRYSMPHGEIIGILTDVGTEAKYKFQAQNMGKGGISKTRNSSLPVISYAFYFYSQFLSTRSTKNLCFSFSVKRS